MSIVKRQISPVVPVQIAHHRELPVGDYIVVLDGFQSLRLLMETRTRALYLVDWTGKIDMSKGFEVGEDGSLGRDVPGRPEDGYPG